MFRFRQDVHLVEVPLEEATPTSTVYGTTEIIKIFQHQLRNIAQAETVLETKQQAFREECRLYEALATPAAENTISVIFKRMHEENKGFHQKVTLKILGLLSKLNASQYSKFKEEVKLFFW